MTSDGGVDGGGSAVRRLAASAIGRGRGRTDGGGSGSDAGDGDGDQDRDIPGPVPAHRGDGAEPPSLDVVFGLLSNRRRRIVLRYLRAEGATSLSELSEVVAARENGKRRAEVTTQERKRTYVGLYQCHLPKLEEADVVETDRSRDVRPGPALSELLAVLDATRRSEPAVPPSPSLLGAIVGLLGAGVWGLAPEPVAAIGALVLIAALSWLALMAAGVAGPSTGSTDW